MPLQERLVIASSSLVVAYSLVSINKKPRKMTKNKKKSIPLGRYSVSCNKRVFTNPQTGFPMEDLRFEEEGNYVHPEIFIT